VTLQDQSDFTQRREGVTRVREDEMLRLVFYERLEEHPAGVSNTFQRDAIGVYNTHKFVQHVPKRREWRVQHSNRTPQVCPTRPRGGTRVREDEMLCLVFYGRLEEHPAGLSNTFQRDARGVSNTPNRTPQVCPTRSNGTR